MATDYLSQITGFLQARGLNSAAIAGIEGNGQIESGNTPTAYNANEGAIGLFQWENGRRTNLQNTAASLGLQETDINAQLEFFWRELSGPYSNVLHELQTATDPGQAAAIFDAQYEGSAGTSRGARVSAAQAIFTNGGATNGTPPAGGAQALGPGATNSPAPFPVSSLVPPLGDKRNTIIAWLAALPAANVAGGNSVAQLQSKTDVQLIGLYTVANITGSVSTNIIPNPFNLATEWVQDLFNGILGIGKSLLKYVEDGGLILLGIIFILIALYIIAKAGSSETDDQPKVSGADVAAVAAA